MSIIYASLSDPTVKAQYRDALDRHLGPDAILAGPAADALREHRLDPQAVSWLQKLSTEGTRIIMDTYSLAERPDLVDQFWGVGGDWPTFMLKDPVARTRYELATELFPDLHLLALEDDQVIARVHAVPIPWPGADELPTVDGTGRWSRQLTTPPATAAPAASSKRESPRTYAAEGSAPPPRRGP